MNNFVIENTKSTPYVEVSYDLKRLTLRGESYPENAYAFYEPIYAMIDEYFTNYDKMIVNVKLSYINTSSIKCLILLFDKLNTYYKNSKDIVINWFYDVDNGFDYEMGQDFRLDIDIPFSFISVNYEEK